MPKYELSELQKHYRLGHFRVDPVQIKGFRTNYTIEKINSSMGYIYRICEINSDYHISEYTLDFHLRLIPHLGTRIELTGDMLTLLIC